MNINSLIRKFITLIKEPKVKRGLFILIPLSFLLIALIVSSNESKDSSAPVFKVTQQKGGNNVTFFTSEESDVDTGLSPVPVNTSENNTFAGKFANEGVYESESPPDYSVSITAREKLKRHLPLYIEDFETSVGITTTTHIFVVPGDRKDTVRVEIYGIEYFNRDIRQEYALDATAFKESFLKVKELIESKGVLVSDLKFIFGTRDFIQSTANYWVDTFKLL